MEDGYAHVDIANQINNSWNKDSVLAIREGNVSFSVKIKTIDKKYLRKRFVEEDRKKYKRHNMQVATIIHAFLLFRLLDEFGEKFSRVKICNDSGSFSYFNKYYFKICKIIGRLPNVMIKPRRGGGKSDAHKIANDVFRGRKCASMVVRKKDVENICLCLKRIMNL